MEKCYRLLKHFVLDLAFTKAIYLFKVEKCLKCLCAKFLMSKTSNKLKPCKKFVVVRNFEQQ